MDGALLGLTRNMHRSYRFDLREVLARPGIATDGAHHLTVDFRSALEYAEEVEDELGERAHNYPHPFNMVRKMACSFGWDWGPDLQTAGIWKPVELQRWRLARLATVRPLVTTDGTAGRVEAHVAVERSGLGLDDDAPLTVTAAVAGVRAEVSVGPGETSVVVVVEVPEVDLWWPLGHGEQPRYDLTVSLATGDAALDTYQRRIGFRTVELDTSPDAYGTSFTFRVNGRPILPHRRARHEP
jgi:beta-mannosidase